jgi:hypothetical protein
VAPCSICRHSQHSAYGHIFNSTTPDLFSERTQGTAVSSGGDLPETFGATDPATRERLNANWINVSNEMDGLDKASASETARRCRIEARTRTPIDAHHSETGCSFRKGLLAMAALKNWGQRA